MEIYGANAIVYRHTKTEEMWVVLGIMNNGFSIGWGAAVSLTVLNNT